jgi:hypothetical protein
LPGGHRARGCERHGRRSLDEAEIRRELIPQIAAGQYEAIALCLLSAYAAPRHEARVKELIAEALPDIRVACSHEVASEFREYERASTTVLSAYVQPVIDGYLARFEATLAKARFLRRVQRDAVEWRAPAGSRDAAELHHGPVQRPGRGRRRSDTPGGALESPGPHHLRHGRHLD